MLAEEIQRFSTEVDKPKDIPVTRVYTAFDEFRRAEMFCEYAQVGGPEDIKKMIELLGGDEHRYKHSVVFEE